MFNSYNEPEIDESELVLTEDESDDIITSLKDELILESILEQIENPLNSSYGSSDYLEAFRIRYVYLSDIHKNSPDFLKKLDEVKDDMYSKIFSKIIEKFNFTYNASLLNIYECTEYLYSFFILDYKDNIIEYLLNVILREKKSIASSLSSPEFSKKLGANALKKLLKNKDDAVIISNINYVIDNLVQRKADNLEIIDNICNNDLSEAANYRVHQYFIEDFSLAPSADFNDLFFAPIIKKQEGFSLIINTVKTELLKLVPKK